MRRRLTASPARRFPRRPAGVLGRILDLALAGVILLLLFLVTARFQELARITVSGPMTVVDGDSLESDGERLRLRGIDAPELGQTCDRDGRSYPCGRASRDALAGLAKTDRLECRGWQRDRYGRLLATCTAGGGEINRRLVELGWAIANGDYEAEEARARQARRGLWAGSFERPQDWRARHGVLAESKPGLLDLALDWIRSILGVL